ncbi:GNAT family N-acetyltransferase [Rubricella aquisinus]|nr:GNAT family N-acetyltransferase [Rubricella aquisinus]
MTDPSEYTFRKVTLADADLLQRWRAAPHVRAWWAPSPPYSAAQLDDPDVDRWIVSMGDRPFGFMQDYTVHGAAEHHFAHLPAGARGIDQFIGEAELLGQGHGPGFIRARMMALFDAGTPVIATDPHPDNHRAIAAYRKLGFRVTGPAQETQWGLILPMMATAGEVR